MARRIITFLFCVVGLVAYPVITNICQCLNVELTSAILNDFPDMDTSTPHNSALCFVKGMIVGDYRSFLYPLTDASREEESGKSNLSLLTASQINNFHDFVVAQGFTNHVICANYQNVSGQVAVIRLAISSRHNIMTKTNDVKMIMVRQQGDWRISQWDVDE